MAKNYILDTNILLFDPDAIFRFENQHVIIPVQVIEELEQFKHDTSESGRNARRTAQIIDRLRERGNLGESVQLDNGSSLRIFCNDPQTDGPPPENAAEAVLQLGARLGRTEPAVIVTKNVNLRVKADALGIPAQDYDMDATPGIDRYRGWHVVQTDGKLVERLAAGKEVRLPELNPFVNEYVFLRDRLDAKHARPGRATAAGTIAPIPDTTRTVCGIRALNLDQTFTLDALLEEDIKVVTLAGKAGTGKTLLALAAGLHLVFGKNRFHRVLVFRPTMPVSRDLGYLPGNLDEKMGPWMQPVYDALELIRSQDRRCSARTLPADVMDCEEISVEPLTYIRGRSIPNQFIIIDEAQNLTPLEVKTVLTRVGTGSKVALTGDPYQIDNPYVDAHSNGLSYLVNRFRESTLSAHIMLQKGERSELAETAANLL